MLRTVSVVFTTHVLEPIVANSMKKYLFLYDGVIPIKVGDLVRDLTYDSPMQIVEISSKITRVTSCGTPVKYLRISYIVSSKFNRENEKRFLEVNINIAKKWYNSNNGALKELALQTFKEEELIENFGNIYECIKTQSVCLNIPTNVNTKKYEVLAELETYASYYNKNAVNKSKRYFIGTLSHPPYVVAVNHKYNLGVYMHTSVNYGLVYFYNIDDVLNVINIMGNKLKYLFNEQ